jgi:lactate permease
MPLGEFRMDVVIAVFPIVLLIFLMTKKNNVPSHKALPFVALLMYVLKLVYFQSDPNIVNATVISGLLYAWTPILIIWGAIFLFKVMETSGSMDVIRKWLNNISGNPIAQLMIIGWAFAFLIEGASGFGTPAALAAPILIGLGFNPVRTAILCLIMNSIPVSFGAVGTPTWFGLGDQLALAPEVIREIGVKTSLIHGAASLVIPVIALRFIVSWQQIRRNLLFIYLSILSCVIPYILLARYDYEFPSILGGMIGLFATVFLAHKQIGLEKMEQNAKEAVPVTSGHLVKAMFPLWGTVGVLLLTRIPQLGIKGLLIAEKPFWDIPLGSLGTLAVAPSCVVKLTKIFMTDVAWKHQLLYIPSIIPFFLVSVIAFFVFKMKRQDITEVWLESYHRMYRPILALLGALVFVKLIMVGGVGEQSCTQIIGNAFASAVGDNWKYFASYLGAVGAFFAGSNTVSNMTFGGIQDSIAQSLGLSRTTILSLQSVGGAMGNMVCINNIVAVCSIVGILDKEGYILKRTVIPMIIYGLIAACVAYFL